MRHDAVEAAAAGVGRQGDGAVAPRQVGPVGRTLLDEAGEAVGAAARAIGGAAALAIGGPAARCSEVARTSARAIDF